MGTVRPRLLDVNAREADTFARGRIRDWRHRSRHDRLAARLGVVSCADIAADPRGAADAAWWEVPAPASVACAWATCADVLERLLTITAEQPVVLVWARVGPNDLTISDQGWAAAAGGSCSTPPTLLVVTGSGWHTCAGGAGRTWRRAPTPTA